MKVTHQWLSPSVAITLAAVAVSLCIGVAPAQDPPLAPSIPQPDLTSAQLDWDPQREFYWPKKAWNRDPWWSTARVLVRPSLRDDMKYEPENKIVRMVAQDWNHRLLKVLMPQVTQVSETEAYVSSSGNVYVELTMAKFQGALPFEIRQSIWVWTFWFPKATPGGFPTVEEVRAILPDAFRSRFVPVTEREFPAGTSRLFADDQPPYFRDMLLFETKYGVLLCGSKIMGAIAMTPSHRNLYWFTRPNQQQQRTSKTW